MKRLGHHFFANLFGSKGSIEKVETSKEVFTTSSGQPHVLQEKMQEKKVKPWRNGDSNYFASSVGIRLG